jgi:voltage-gated sodium channel
MSESFGSRMARLAQQIVAAKPFRATVIAVILFAGVLAGLETNAALVAQHRALITALDSVVLAVFISEIVLKLAAHGRRPLDYFRDGWNVFDFAIVALCVLPIGGPFAAVLRLARTLRLLRLITALPKLQLLVGALLHSLGSMGYVSLLLGLIFYIYAVVGIHLFGPQSPQHFGSLPLALMSLFQMITLDNWSDLFHAARGSTPIAATIYFISFILLGTMIMLNLFIGVVMNSMAEMHTELNASKPAAAAGEHHGSPDANAIARKTQEDADHHRG